MTGTERLRNLFRYFAVTQCRGRSPVYETLSNGVIDDDTLLDLLLRTPADQRRPSLLFAAVNHLLRAHPDAPLAAYYPIHGGARPADDELVPTFAAFCQEHAEELARLLRDGSTQTNDIRRCVALRVALEHVRRRRPGPLALVEVGASAGLNLMFDRYGYPGTPNVSPVSISCELRGPVDLGPMPEITSRLGVDLNPITLTDPDQRAWLEAFIWPEDTDGLATLRNAVDLALSTGAATVVRGDATTDTAALLAALPGDEPVAVFTASLLSYLDTDARTAFAGQLREAVRDRPVAWVFAESPGLVATAGLDLPALNGPLARRNGLYVVGASLSDDGDSLLGLADPYLRWLAPARHPSDDFRWLPTP
ncbi:MAG TPA: DUF2332 domain-containing protein [Pseudonocardiaceae bacterium]|nr:DUF2332 domain-containing protein [Pseudonocardiaceae bacterium]